MKSLNLTPELYKYILLANPPEHESLKKLRIETDKLKYARLRSPTEQIHFLMFFLKLLKPKHILELGTFTGYATLSMALATPQETRITTCDLNDVFPRTGLVFWEEAGVAERIELRLGHAKTTLAELISKNSRFDFIFIDADKQNIEYYFEQSLKLLNENGVILVDNVLWRGEVLQEVCEDERAAAMKAFNARLKQDPRIEYCLLPVGDGITLISKK